MRLVLCLLACVSLTLPACGDNPITTATRSGTGGTTQVTGSAGSTAHAGGKGGSGGSAASTGGAGGIGAVVGGGGACPPCLVDKDCMGGRCAQFGGDSYCA